MIEDSPDAGRGQVPVIYLVPFLLIAFGLTWGSMALCLLFPEQITEVFGELSGEHPLCRVS